MRWLIRVVWSLGCFFVGGVVVNLASPGFDQLCRPVSCSTLAAPLVQRGYDWLLPVARVAMVPANLKLLGLAAVCFLFGWALRVIYREFHSDLALVGSWVALAGPILGLCRSIDSGHVITGPSVFWPMVTGLVVSFLVSFGGAALLEYLEERGVVKDLAQVRD